MYGPQVPSELLRFVTDILDEDPANRVMNLQAGWNPVFHNVFGQVFGDVRTIIPHHTAGWPTRAKATGFVNRYTLVRYGENNALGQVVVPCLNCGPNPQPQSVAGCECKWGIGPQYYISADGSIARLISNLHDEARVTFHGGYTNGWSIGVETGSLFREAAPPGSGWVRVNQAPAGDDVPGANLFLRDLRDAPREVIACWWTTAGYTGSAREATGAGTMLFSEAQYRSWAVLARFLAEQFGVPRSFPLLPHAQRGSNAGNSASYRRVVLADPGYAGIVADLPVGWGMTAAQFENNPAALQTQYAARSTGGQHPQNQAWNRLFQTYRGIHGHAFSGDTGGRDHDCPGPVFDWHRFARQVWDWWWYPFDVADPPFPGGGGQSTAAPARGYRHWDGTTPLIEHYFDDDNHQPGAMILDSRHEDRTRLGVHGTAASPSTWRLDANSPVYALANGELVAARFAHPSRPASMSFVLVRHRVFHLEQGHPAAAVGRIDYDRPADTVYSLYMHLGHPTGLDLTAVNDANPDWLNRVHLRKRECHLGITFYDHATHHGIPDAAWNQPLPGNAARPTLAAGWRIDDTALDAFLTTLQAGGVAIAPTVDQGTPIQIILGDFLGTGGVVGPAATDLGVRVEVFSPAFQAPTFALTGGGVGWDAVPPAFAGLPIQRYPSEWSRVPAGAEAAALTAAGVDLTLVPWWLEVARAMTLDPRVAQTDRLPADGTVFHYRAFDFLSWLNGVTWASEWPKFHQVDAGGIPVVAPAQPRSRRF